MHHASYVTIDALLAQSRRPSVLVTAVMVNICIKSL